MDHRSIEIRVLRAIDDALRHELVPDTRQDSSKILGEMISRLLRWLAIRLEDHQEFLEGHETGTRQAIRDAERLLSVDGPPGSSAEKPKKDFASIFIRLERAVREEGKEGRAAALALLERIVGGQELLLRRFDPDPVQSILDAFRDGFKHSADRKRPIDLPVSDETLTGYLRARFPNTAELRAVHTRRLAGGYGKDTIFFEVEGDGPFVGPMVMRKDMRASSIGAVAADEFPLLAAIFARGIPVPEPLWVERDTTWFGGTFIVVRRITGSADVGAWIGNSQACRLFADELAKIMAQVHSIGGEDLGKGGAPGSAIEGTRGNIEAMLHIYQTRTPLPNPRVEAGFAWMLANLPKDDGRAAALVHGDIGFHNMLMAGGKVTALLDWEFAHLGDPAEDVSYCRPFVEAILPWPEFLQMYYRHGGAPYSDEQDRFYAVWRNLRNAAACVGYLGLFSGGQLDDVRSATAALIQGPRFELEMLRTIIGGAK